MQENEQASINKVADAKGSVSRMRRRSEIEWTHGATKTASEGSSGTREQASMGKNQPARHTERDTELKKATISSKKATEEAKKLDSII